MTDRNRSVTVFGWSGGAEGCLQWQIGEAVGRAVAQAGFRLVNGGYSGTMMTSARGARAAQPPGEVEGVTCPSLFPGRTDAGNEYVTVPHQSTSLVHRLARLVGASRYIVTLPGTLGTLAELALVWYLAAVAQHNGSKPWRIYVWGNPWKEAIDKVCTHLGIDDSLRQLVEPVDSVEELMASIAADAHGEKAPEPSLEIETAVVASGNELRTKSRRIAVIGKSTQPCDDALLQEIAVVSRHAVAADCSLLFGTFSSAASAATCSAGPPKVAVTYAPTAFPLRLRPEASVELLFCVSVMQHLVEVLLTPVAIFLHNGGLGAFAKLCLVWCLATLDQMNKLPVAAVLCDKGTWCDVITACCDLLGICEAHRLLPRYFSGAGELDAVLTSSLA
eukprot:TRINITY_DN9598_c0_g1_i1.p1 TRINITY_DN9598_c0_g1~~TRINITY_DN9598_c0_g1_i1.p1  ORF type:complete len:390 (-),score=53.55 TRINITY_DN9598_c0_g1_i1:923-2092(-)